MTHDDVRELLRLAGLTLDADDEIPNYAQTLNMNDVWGWAYAWCKEIPDEELLEVGRLFVSYGWCGILYWVSCKHDNMQSEFADINRFIEFVRTEEAIRHEEPLSSRRAYLKRVYSIGDT